MEQRSNLWFKARLGKFTGSRVGELIGKPKKAENLFSETAWNYIMEVFAERNLSDEIIKNEDMFSYYLEEVSVTSKAMRWGTEQEGSARVAYELATGFSVREVGLIEHPTIENLASSPDGVIFDENGTLEIKCMGNLNYAKALISVQDNESLKAFNKKYYYQCQCHMMCTGMEWCDFVVYNPFMKQSLHITRINPDPIAFEEIEKCVNIAEIAIGDWLHNTTNLEEYKQNIVEQEKDNKK